MVMETGVKLEAPMYQWQIKRIADDAKTWQDRGGKIVKLSDAEQADAVKRIAASLKTVLDKNPPSKELYTKLKAIADTVK